MDLLRLSAGTMKRKIELTLIAVLLDQSSIRPSLVGLVVGWF
jgi:hypothetical protein